MSYIIQYCHQIQILSILIIIVDYFLSHSLILVSFVVVVVVLLLRLLFRYELDSSIVVVLNHLNVYWHYICLELYLLHCSFVRASLISLQLFQR